MVPRTLILMLCIFAGSLTYGNSECKDLEFYKCLKKVPSDAFGKYFEWDQSKENILLYITRIHDKFCDISEPVMNCMLEFAKDCPDEDLKDLGKLLKGRNQLLHKVCSAGVVLKQEFLDSLECLSDHQNEIFEECEKEMHQQAEGKGDCKSYWTTQKCIYKISQLICGDEASALLKLFTGPANALMKKKCSVKF